MSKPTDVKIMEKAWEDAGNITSKSNFYGTARAIIAAELFRERINGGSKNE